MESKQLCLKFANTAEWHASAHPEEHLHNYSDLVQWAQRAGILSEQQAQDLLDEASRQPGNASRVLKKAITLREAIYRIFSAISHGRQPSGEDLITLNRGLTRALERLQVVPAQDGFAWNWQAEPKDLDRMLWPVVKSAADLLTSDELHRVKECADDRGCGELFLDMSKNRSRKWCSMEGCGNRAKVRQYYLRKKSGVEAEQ